MPICSPFKFGLDLVESLVRDFLLRHQLSQQPVVRQEVHQQCATYRSTDSDNCDPVSGAESNRLIWSKRHC